MKEVIVQPEKCVGCMQCMVACATAHSRTQALYTAVLETPVPKSRIHVGAGLYNEGFPNRCRHCDPAPCMLACLGGAIFRDAATRSVLIDPDRCINCASCAMACPYGVIRFHEDCGAPPEKVVAIKCDNCDQRQSRGLVPACTEVCKTGALTFAEMPEAMKEKTNAVARSLSPGAEGYPASPAVALLTAAKKAQLAL